MECGSFVGQVKSRDDGPRPRGVGWKCNGVGEWWWWRMPVDGWW